MSEKELVSKKRSRSGFRRHSKNTESEIIHLIQNFDEKNPEHLTKLKALKCLVTLPKHSFVYRGNYLLGLQINAGTIVTKFVLYRSFGNVNIMPKATK